MKNANNPPPTPNALQKLTNMEFIEGKKQANKHSVPKKKTEDKIAKLRKHFQSLSKEEKEDYLRSLTPAQYKPYIENPDIFLYDKQIIPDKVNDHYWLYYLLRCGRSFGKTYSGSAWVAKQIRNGAKVIGLCGPTYDDVAQVMVPAILKWFLPSELPETPYNNQTHIVRFNNGAVIHCYTSDKEIRGPNLEYLWCDEICVWSDGDPDKIKTRFEDITRAVRVGSHPQTIITSTPKTHPFFIDFQDKVDSGDPNYVMIQGSIQDNPTLPKAYVEEQISKYGSSARGRQELFGDLIKDASGAYWTHSLIDDCRSNVPVNRPKQVKLPGNAYLMGYAKDIEDSKDIYLVRTGIGFDPAVSKNNDECGIIVASIYSNNKAYVLGDYSGKYNPNEWSKLINKLYVEYHCGFLAVEKNNGGNTFEYILRSVNPHINVIPIHATQGKTTRAEHTSALYNQGKVFHTANFKELEDQMCSFNVNYSKSPDRVDALNLVLTELFWSTNRHGSTYNMTIKNLPKYNK